MNENRDEQKNEEKGPIGHSLCPLKIKISTPNNLSSDIFMNSSDSIGQLKGRALKEFGFLWGEYNVKIKKGDDQEDNNSIARLPLSPIRSPSQEECKIEVRFLFNGISFVYGYFFLLLGILLGSLVGTAIDCLLYGKSFGYQFSNGKFNNLFTVTFGLFLLIGMVWRVKTEDSPDQIKKKLLLCFSMTISIISAYIGGALLTANSYQPASLWKHLGDGEPSLFAALVMMIVVFMITLLYGINKQPLFPELRRGFNQPLDNATEEKKAEENKEEAIEETVEENREMAVQPRN